jgi:hypothetical protein
MTRLLTMCAEMDEGLTVPLEAQAAWRKAVRATWRTGRRRGGWWSLDARHGLDRGGADAPYGVHGNASAGCHRAPAQYARMSAKAPVNAMYDASARTAASSKTGPRIPA